jgi:short-subunit dehydrogenase
MDLQNKVALITGASRGIGQNISCSMAEKGVHVIITARTESPEKGEVNPKSVG